MEGDTGENSAAPLEQFDIKEEQKSPVQFDLNEEPPLSPLLDSKAEEKGQEYLHNKVKSMHEGKKVFIDLNELASLDNPWDEKTGEGQVSYKIQPRRSKRLEK